MGWVRGGCEVGVGWVWGGCGVGEGWTGVLRRGGGVSSN